MMNNTRTLPFLALLALTAGCAASPRALRPPEMEPLPVMATTPDKPAPLAEDLFRQDAAGNVSEEALRRILEAPVFLEEGARVGVVRVASRYEVDGEIPLGGTTGALADVVQSSGLFEVASEVSTDFPADRGLAGLRELAARYRAEYLLLYRHRFIERSWINGWGAAFVTLIGIPFVPANTLETAGVVEATLLDVKSGTLLFTVFERMHHRGEENVWQNERKLRAVQEALLVDASGRLADQVLFKLRKLAAARPEDGAKLSARSEVGHHSGVDRDLVVEVGEVPDLPGELDPQASIEHEVEARGVAANRALAP
jgi:hypothetical protein